MTIIDVIELELDNKSMPNEINALGVHVDIYVYVHVMYALLDPGLAYGFRHVKC